MFTLTKLYIFELFSEVFYKNFVGYYILIYIFKKLLTNGDLFIIFLCNSLLEGIFV